MRNERAASSRFAIARSHSAGMTTRHFTYVLALLFSADRSRVVLMRKTRPAWQAGRVNAPGGKLLPDESPCDAARREVREEAGVDVARWEEFLAWDDPVYRLHAVRAFDDAALRAHTAEDQEVFLADTAALPPGLIDNLRWLIPLALDADVGVPIRVASAKPEGSGLTEAPPEGA
jgi:8-oxo-dGTP diphosphatase